MKKVYILTNGFLESGYNYISMFKTKNDTINYSKINHINLKYDLYELDIPVDLNNISIMFVQSNNEKKIQYISDFETTHSSIISYYQNKNNEIENEMYKNFKIKSNLFFKDDHTILQFFGNNDLDSFSIITNISFHNTKNII